MIKTGARKLPDDTARHGRDLALLLVPVRDPFAMCAELTTSDQRSLRGGTDAGRVDPPGRPLYKRHVNPDRELAALRKRQTAS